MRITAQRLALLACALLAAAGFESFPVSPSQLEQNQARWDAMDEDARESLRRTWQRFSVLPESEQHILRLRMATLTRLQEQHERRTGTPATEEELERLLEELPARFLSRVRQPPDNLAIEVRRHTQLCINAFLDSLVAMDRLTAADRPRARDLPWAEFVQRSLELRKREDLRLAERSRSEPTDDLLDLDPLVLTDQMRERRRKVGYLGRAAQHVDLTDEERRELRTLPEDQLFDYLKARMASRIRTLLEERSVATETIEKILKAPPRRQERLLDELLKGD